MNLSVRSQIPQTSIQEIFFEGEFNQVQQKLNQNLSLNFIYFSQFQESVISRFNIQESFLKNPNNQVNQQINQTALDFSLVNTSLMSFSADIFLNNDNILNGVQFNSQEVFLAGNHNRVIQQSTQTLTDFFFLDRSSEIIEEEDFNQFLERLLASKELDSLQFSLQDTFVLGNHNFISQTIDQTLNSFIFTSHDFQPFFEANITTEAESLNPTYLTIQETFIDRGNNNLIDQNINQTIIDISFFAASNFSQNKDFFVQTNDTIFERNNLVDFDIDAFINTILNDTLIEGTQINRQLSETLGDRNEITQINEQVLLVSIPEPSSLETIVFLVMMALLQKLFIWFGSLYHQGAKK